MMEKFDLKEIVSAFLVLFAVIDITGAIPVILDLKHKGRDLQPLKTTLMSFLIFILFLFGGITILGFFNVDISSFAVAGSIILFVMATEMIFGVTLFKGDDGADTQSVVVPLVFPLIAGAAAFTTLISLRAEFQLVNIIIAIMLNMGIVYLVLRYVDVVEKVLGKGGVYILKKVFGIILLAIAVRLFVENITSLMDLVNGY